jgi:hypothetical protein
MENKIFTKITQNALQPKLQYIDYGTKLRKIVLTNYKILKEILGAKSDTVWGKVTTQKIKEILKCSIISDPFWPTSAGDIA